jgi:5-methylcytosine-specific restriction protein A
VHAQAQALAKEHRRPNRDVRKWYYLAKWVHPVWGLRAQVLGAQPWCATCYARGVLEPAIAVDHIIPHRGEPARFWDRGNLQGLCVGCHQRKTRQGA